MELLLDNNKNKKKIIIIIIIITDLYSTFRSEDTETLKPPKTPKGGVVRHFPAKLAIS